MNKRGRRVGSCAGAASVLALIAAAAPFAPDRQREDWDHEAGSAARRRIVDLAPPGAEVQFADVRVRPSDRGDARSVCGSFAVWGEGGSLGAFRDFWVVVTRKRDTEGGIESARPMAIGRDEFLDRGSAYYMNCFSEGG